MGDGHSALYAELSLDRRKNFVHYQQGLTGIIEEGSDGLLLGAIYLSFGRNLAIPIVAHRVCDTIDIALLFLGKYPGV